MEPRSSPGCGRLALIVVDESGEILLADGPALATFGVDADAIGQDSTTALARYPELVRAVDGALDGRRSSLRLAAGGCAFDVSVEVRRGGGAIIAAIDVTADRARNREISLVFRQVPGAVWSTDRELIVTRAFGRVAAELALDATAVVNQSIFDVLGSSADDALTRAHRAALHGERTSYRYAFRGRRFDVITEPLRDVERSIIGTVSAAVDVTSVVEAMERLADAQRVAHVGSWEWDIPANRVTWSEEMFEIFGLDSRQFTPTFAAFFDHVVEEDVVASRETVFGALKEPKAFVYDHRIARPDGSIRMLHMRGDVLVDSAGKPLRMLGTCWDITDRWQTGRALEKTASLLQATLEATADGVLVIDRDDRITAHNERFLEMWSLPAELVKDGDANALRAYVLDQLEDPTAFLRTASELHANPSREAFDTIRFRDGRVFERTARPQLLGDEVVGRVWSYRDVSDREVQFRRAVFLSDVARLLSSLDVERALTSVAHLAVPYLGDCCAIDLLGDGPPRRVQAVAHEGASVQTPELARSVLLGRGSIYAVSATPHMAVPLVVSGRVEGAITFAASAGRRYTARDLEIADELAQRVALALEKAHLLQRAEAALRARDEFLAIAAHEIRGPVTSMHAAVQALRRRKLHGPAETRAFELIEREDRRLARFVDELLDLGLTRAEVRSFDIEEVGLAGLIRDVVSAHDDEVARSGSALALDLDEHAVGLWNRDRLEKVIANLLTNALKFGLGKPIKISLKVRNGKAILRVLDHGIGIPADARKRIFQPFERAVSVRHYGGLGLGLFIASSIVNAFGGSLTVESEPGVGSRFTAELPLLEAVQVHNEPLAAPRNQ